MKVNDCGVPETEFKNGVCRFCGKQCEMMSEQLIDKRIYDYGRKYGLNGSPFNPYFFVSRIKETGLLDRAPMYVKKFVQEVEENKK